MKYQNHQKVFEFILSLSVTTSKLIETKLINKFLKNLIDKKDFENID